MNPEKRTISSCEIIRPHATAGTRRVAGAASIGLSWLIAVACFPVPAWAEDVKRDTAGASLGEAKMTVDPPLNNLAVSFKPGGRRDPFLNPLAWKKKSKESGDEMMDRGAAPPGIAGTLIAQATLKGISIQDNGRVAILRGVDNRVYFLREGDRLFDGFVKLIDVDSVTLVRETPMKSKKVLTQDVIIRLRTP